RVRAREPREIRPLKVRLLAAPFHEVGTDPARAAIELLLLFRAEVDRHADEAVVGQRPALDLRDLLPERYRSDQRVEQALGPIGTRRRGRQSEAHGREAVERALVKARARKVMGLVEHDETVAVAHLLHVDPRTVVRGDSERPDLATPVAEDPSIEPEPL